MEHWTDTFEHSTVTAENKEAFNTHMAKFKTQEDAVADGYGLAKMKNIPFKLPESLDKLPDDASRGEFTSSVHKLFNIRKAASIDELKDVNLKDGLPEGVNYDESFAAAYKQHVFDNKLNVSEMPANAKFFNTIMAKIKTDNATKLENENIATAEKVEAELIAHPDIGSKENLTKLTEQFKRAMEKHVGLTADEVTELADDLAISKLSKNSVLSRVLLKQFAPLAATADMEDSGKPSGDKETKVDPNAGSPSHDAIWGSTPEEKASYKQSQEKTAPV